MSEIHLNGLVGTHPLGALAAFGLLRCCEEMADFRGARMGWRREPDWHAFLETPKPTEPAGLVTALVSRQKQRAESPELTWADSIKTEPKSYRDALQSGKEQLSKGDRTFADFMAAFACELLTDGNRRLEPTAFYMTSGQQKFLKEIRTLAENLTVGISIGRRRKTPEEMFFEALFGPWRYEDPQHSLGWDPTTERTHALSAKRPKSQDNAGVSAGIWLALEAMALFPCFLNEERLVTTGFNTKAAFFTWPLWANPISLSTLRSLLSLELLTRDHPPKVELQSRGIEQAFRSERYKVKTKGSYYILRPAIPCL